MSISQQRHARNDMDMQRPTLVTAKDIAETLSCHEATVWRYSARGILPRPIRIGRRTFWDLNEIQALISQKLASRSEVDEARAEPMQGGR